MNVFHEVPKYSQHLDIKNGKWKKKSCGIVCLAMILNKLDEKISPDELLKISLKFNFAYKDKKYPAFLPGVGWNHWGLAHIAEKLNLQGIVCDWNVNNDKCKKLNKKIAFKELTKLLKKQPLMASIKKSNNSGGGHLVVLTGINSKEISYNDPNSNNRNKIEKSASIEEFIRGWKKRIIVIQKNKNPR